MRFKFLVAVEIFFVPLFFIGCDWWRTVDDVTADLTSSFKPDTSVQFRCPETFSCLSHTLKVKAINLTYEDDFLLCLEEFMCSFRSFFEETYVESSEEQLVNFCRFVATKLPKVDAVGDNESHVAVLFLNLCKIFWGAEQGDEDNIRDFRIIVRAFFDGIKLEDNLSNFSSTVFSFLKKFNNTRFKTAGVLYSYENLSEAISKLKLRELSFFILQDKNNELFYEKKFINANLFIYGDFVVFEYMGQGSCVDRVIWKREHKNKHSKYHFYRKLTSAKKKGGGLSDGGMVDNNSSMPITINGLRGQLKSYIVDEVEQLIRGVKEILSIAGESSVEIDEQILNRLKKGDNDVMLYGVSNSLEYLTWLLNDISSLEFTDALEKVKKAKKSFLSYSEKFFETNKKSLLENPQKGSWFQGLSNIGNSCYFNALIQNLFEFKEKLKKIIKACIYKCLSTRNTARAMKSLGLEIGEQDDPSSALNHMFKESDFGKILLSDQGDMLVLLFDKNFSLLWNNCSINYPISEFLTKTDSIDGVLEGIYEYLKRAELQNAPMVFCEIFTYSDHAFARKDCRVKYRISITPVYVWTMYSHHVANGLELSAVLNTPETYHLTSACPMCGKKISTQHTCKYYNFGDFLFISLSRYCSGKSMKNEIPIPDVVDFGGCKYEISGIASQYGSLHSGHYLAFKKRCGLWFKFNDNAVVKYHRSLSVEDVEAAYMLFFKKIQPSHSMSNGEKSKQKQQKQPTLSEEDIGYGNILLGELSRHYSYFYKKFLAKRKLKTEAAKEGDNTDVTFAEILEKNVIAKKNNNNVNVECDDDELLLNVYKYCQYLDQNILQEEKKNELEKLGKSIVLFFFNKNNVLYDPSMCLNIFMKIFFKKFYDFDKTCVDSDNNSNLDLSNVDFVFTKDNLSHIREDRTLPFFMSNSKNFPMKCKLKLAQEGETVCANNNKVYCLWDDAIIIAKESSEVKEHNKNIITNRISLQNSLNHVNHNDSKKEDDNLENLAIYKAISYSDTFILFDKESDEVLRQCELSNFIKEKRDGKISKLDKLLESIAKMREYASKCCDIDFNKLDCDSLNKMREDYIKYKKEEKESLDNFIKYLDNKKSKIINEVQGKSSSSKNDIPKKKDNMKAIDNIDRLLSSIGQLVGIVSVELKALEKKIEEEEIARRKQSLAKFLSDIKARVVVRLNNIAKDVLKVKGFLRNGGTPSDEDDEFLTSSFRLKNVISPYDQGCFNAFVIHNSNELSGIFSSPFIVCCDIVKYLLLGKTQPVDCLYPFSDSDIGGRWFAGIRNMANFCYINALLQCLIEFKDDIRAMQELDEKCHDAKFNDPLKTVVHDVLKDMVSDGYIDLVKSLKIALEHEYGSIGDPRDIYEVLFAYYYYSKLCRIELIEGDENQKCEYELCSTNTNNDTGRFIYTKGLSDNEIIERLYSDDQFLKYIEMYFPLSRRFYGLTNRICGYHCEGCGLLKKELHISYSSNCNINVQECTSKKISECKGLFKVGGMSSENIVECGRCKGKKCRFSESCCYMSLNNCVCIKFDYIARGDRILVRGNKVLFDDVIKHGEDEYEINSICYHTAMHYVTLKRKYGMWFLFDDNKVTCIGCNMPQQSIGKAIFVFYKKKKKDNLLEIKT